MSSLLQFFQESNNLLTYQRQQQRKTLYPEHQVLNAMTTENALKNPWFCCFPHIFPMRCCLLPFVPNHSKEEYLVFSSCIVPYFHPVASCSRKVRCVSCMTSLTVHVILWICDVRWGNKNVFSIHFYCSKVGWPTLSLCHCCFDVEMIQTKTFLSPHTNLANTLVPVFHWLTNVWENGGLCLYAFTSSQWCLSSTSYYRICIK